ncbi:hypothetical protein [Sphingomonas sp.]|uniref:hypothetical protein n=1 Tax=Sphingomonas sp. TaxID=28214 RepID=UPI000DBC0100|nr:hypothetical protein [Sphingomonas sp.]PZT91971.1 MAG: hypothetical protein DI625_14655 [Sphingomonas sp.]
MTRACECGAPLGRRNETGRCRSCSSKRLSLRPEVQEARRIGLRKKYATDPAFKAAHAERMRNLVLSDAAKEKMREVGRKQYRELLSRPDMLERRQSETAKAKRVSSWMATTMPWLPADRIADYRTYRAARYSPAEARAMIEDAIRADAAAEIAARQQAMADKHARDLASRY